jgi:hypothetical protein
VGIDIMSINSILEDPNDVKSYIGAAGNLFFISNDVDEGGRIQKAIELLRQGRFADAFGQGLPDMAGNFFKAYAGYKWGVRSFAGTPLEDADGDIYKYNTWEAIVKATGFTPTKESLLWEEKSRQFEQQDKVSAERSTIRRTIQAQMQRGEVEAARQTQLEAINAGKIDADTDYILEFGRKTFVSDAYKEWQGTAKTTTDVKRIEKQLVENLYGTDATDAEKNNAKRAFSTARTFGEDNKYVDALLSATTNTDKVMELRKAKAEMSEADFSDLLAKGRKEITLESGRTSRLLITDSVLEAFNKVKDIPVQTEKSTFKDNEKTNESNVLNKVLTYAEAIGTDPVTAFNRIFTGQVIRRVDSGAIIVERMSLDDSSAMRREGGATTEMRLDHTVPLQLGGDNSKKNLKLVTTEDWASYTPIENYLGKLLRNGTLYRNKARELIVKFKNKEITADDIYKIK